MKGVHISTMCAAIVVIVALIAYHLGGGGKCREHNTDDACNKDSGYWRNFIKCNTKVLQGGHGTLPLCIAELPAGCQDTLKNAENADKTNFNCNKDSSDWRNFIKCHNKVLQGGHGTLPSCIAKIPAGGCQDMLNRAEYLSKTHP
tara:strand:+ start:125 stop:559 length:435 start_codon:yes stop_codon:yes gene_type:complete